MEREGAGGDGWSALFCELNEAEDRVAAAIESLEHAVKAGKPAKTGHKGDSWRGLHAQLSKSSKAVEKQYPGYTFEKEDESQAAALESMWRDSIGEALVRDGLALDPAFSESAQKRRQAYTQLSQFLCNFDTNFDAIFEWVKREFPASDEKETLLAEFVQFSFFQRLKASNLRGGLALLQEHVGEFKNSKNQKIVSKLLTRCLFSTSTPANGPAMLEAPPIEALKERFVKAYCRVAQIPKADPLSICNEIGTKSIPVLDRLSSLLKGRNYSSLTEEDELPIELPLEDDFVFHSIFSCPILKQQSSETNPPFLLPCGHALSKEALTRLSKGNALVRFKCPYCPTETNFSQCLQLTF